MYSITLTAGRGNQIKTMKENSITLTAGRGNQIKTMKESEGGNMGT